jgi:hypothetical protein
LRLYIPLQGVFSFDSFAQRTRHKKNPFFVWVLINLWPSVYIAQGTLRRGGGYFKPTRYVCRVAPRAPTGVAAASGLCSDL